MRPSFGSPEDIQAEQLCRLALATREGHGGRLSDGAYVLLDISNTISPFTPTPSDQCASFDRLCEAAGRVIAAGC